MPHRRPGSNPTKLLLSEQSWVRQHQLFPGDFPHTCQKKVSDLWITNPLLLQVRCIVERCSDGSIAPVPQGQCCPSKRACPAQVIKICIKISGILDVQNVQYSISLQAYSLESSYSKGSDCTKVTCYLARWKPLRQIFIWSKLPGKVNKSWWIDHQSINISFPGVREVIL